jgi:hypothetical protein
MKHEIEMILAMTKRLADGRSLFVAVIVLAELACCASAALAQNESDDQDQGPPAQEYRREIHPGWSPMRPVADTQSADGEQSAEQIPPPAAVSAPPAAAAAPPVAQQQGYPVAQQQVYAGPNFAPGNYGRGNAMEPWNDDYESICGPLGFPVNWRPFQSRLYVSTEYLLWWTQGSKIPPLLTTSPTGTAQSDAGVLPGATILFGDQLVDQGSHSGGQLKLGYWFGQQNDIAFELSFLDLSRTSDQFADSSNTTAILARPYFDAQTGMPTSEVISYPGVFTGGFTALATSQFEDAEVLLRRRLFHGNGDHLDFIVGYRWARLDDKLDLTEDVIDLATSSTTGRNDTFNTRNVFSGAEVGFLTEVRYGVWTFDTTTKIALGDTYSRVDINGQTTVTGTTTPSAGGLLALPSNIGSHVSNQFSMMPELGITAGYNFTAKLRMTFGYSIMYWNNVARSGDQIDTNINPAQIPPATATPGYRPAFQLHTSDFWAQGVNMGLEYRF